MEKIAVVYETRYGSTKKYAQWIAQDLGCTLIEKKDATVEKLKIFDTIIYGGWLHAGNIKGFKVISKDIDKLKDKNIVVFSVGCSTGERDEDIKTIEEMNFKDLQDIKHFYLRGAFNYKNLNMIDKVMMNILKIKLKGIKEGDRDEDIKGMLDAYINPMDFTNKDNVRSLVSYVRNL
ncbi:flavodoxin domain-containing protein [Metaclostridioides mangenotii]|uniref:flavodoxin domain-containing protein n=1 Tax=Metaclostridioides mangenotii TaxID=1540 RepID=UPI0026EB44A8|nr:flavodoxin domain-containing protein [Clostridioides mangenotii]